MPSVGPEQLAEAEVILATAITTSNYISQIDPIAKLLSGPTQMLSVHVSRGVSDQAQSIADSSLTIRQEHDDITSQLSTVEKSTSVEMTDMSVVPGELEDTMS